MNDLNSYTEHLYFCKNSLTKITLQLNEYNNIISELYNIINNVNIDINEDIDINININIDDYVDNIFFTELYECIFNIFDDLLNSDIIYLYNNSFIEIIIDNVAELLYINFINILDLTERDDIMDIIRIIGNIYINILIKPRSYKDTFIKNDDYIEDINIINSKIDYLKSVPQPEQRTTEWYLFRHNVLTASNIWKAFDSESAYNNLICEKCKEIDVSKYSVVSTESPMHWGQKYEPISIMWYEYYYKTKISDFGCIRHKEIEYLAASPDGINTCINSKRYGRMLEIKNIVNREINGIPKKEYWIQMQMQMETCDLNECDFLETKFIEYENVEEFNLDGDFNLSKNNNHKGVIMYFIKDGMPYYEYCPFLCLKEEFVIWEKEMMKRYGNLTWMKNIYWKLDKISCILVDRNKEWFNVTKPIIKELWGTILYERENGYEHRLPKKRKITPKVYESENFNKCLINVDSNMLID
tara:strand:+ start:167 stop:1579 length:1413 start_codon:yes stop_codon:yes gene_type:complete